IRRAGDNTRALYPGGTYLGAHYCGGGGDALSHVSFLQRNRRSVLGRRNPAGGVLSRKRYSQCRSVLGPDCGGHHCHLRIARDCSFSQECRKPPASGFSHAGAYFEAPIVRALLTGLCRSADRIKRFLSILTKKPAV